MPATLINAALILLGSILGLLFRNHISPRFSELVTHALSLCVLVIGILSAAGTQNVLCVIVCMVVGSLLGETLRIEDHLDHAGELLRQKLIHASSAGRFTEGFVTASLLFCIGSMAIMGSLEAGMNGNYTILISKGVIDGVTAVTFSAAMGIGVMFSILPLIVYQGGLTLLAAAVGPLLSTSVITEMTAVGGTIIIGIAFNMFAFGPRKIRVGNMLPAIFLPPLYLPLSDVLSHLL
ncbi:MAG: DUF554 domain-containing protein [Intestinimonas sp.]|jgi:uncharacterized membrane protein YqgA involved in biofilm formation|nr:DUF554 domain-containing protein [Intestinimonas sp.]